MTDRILLEDLVSQRLGLVHRMEVRRHSALAFGLSIASAQPADFARLPSGHSIPNCGGVGETDAEALTPALMEVVERYGGLFGGMDGELAGPAQGNSFLYGERLQVFAGWQHEDPSFPFARHDAATHVRWCRGRSLLSGKTAYLPSAWVRVPFNDPMPSERLYCSNSSGMAAAFTLRDAIIRGILELCERDAFMVMWHHRLSLPRLAVDLEQVVGVDVARNVREMGAAVRFVNITNDLQVPVVMCAIEREWHGESIVSIGLSSRPSITEACRKSFFEATSEGCRAITDGNTWASGWKPAPDFSNVRDFSVRPFVYRCPNLRGELGFIWASQQRIKLDEATELPGDGAELLRAVVGRLRPHVEDVVVVPMSTEASRAVGAKVVKVVAPGLVSLYADHRMPHLGCRRIWTSASKLGAATDPALRAVGNVLPHPFA